MLYPMQSGSKIPTGFIHDITQVVKYFLGDIGITQYVTLGNIHPGYKSPCFVCATEVGLPALGLVQYVSYIPCRLVLTIM